MFHPSRGGVRGGKDQFKWEDVKSDQDREYYLGHSLKASVGRWQKGKDLHWYAREKKDAEKEDEAAKLEIQRVKEEEEDMMNEMLGIAPTRKRMPQAGNRLERKEAEDLLKRGTSSEALTAEYAAGERVQGLGFAPAPSVEGRRLKEAAAASAASEGGDRDVDDRQVRGSHEGGPSEAGKESKEGTQKESKEGTQKESKEGTQKEAVDSPTEGVEASRRGTKVASSSGYDSDSDDRKKAEKRSTRERKRKGRDDGKDREKGKKHEGKKHEEKKSKKRLKREKRETRMERKKCKRDKREAARERDWEETVKESERLLNPHRL